MTIQYIINPVLFADRVLLHLSGGEGAAAVAAGSSVMAGTACQELQSQNA